MRKTPHGEDQKKGTHQWERSLFGSRALVCNRIALPLNLEDCAEVSNYLNSHIFPERSYPRKIMNYNNKNFKEKRGNSLSLTESLFMSPEDLQPRVLT